MNKKILLNLKKFRTALEKHGISVNRMIVYGSHAHGDATIDSDIDVAIISNHFRKLNILKRLEILGSILAKARIMAPIEALGYTEDEFRNTKKGTFLADEIKSRGKTINF